jgi:dihydroorotate dehydrogenase (NAD+) catalytic subunit
MSRLSVKVGKLRFSNPTMLASGVLCNGSLLRRAALSGAGAVVTKSLTLQRRGGYPTPVVVGTRTGLLNAVGLANQGIEEFLRNDLPLAKEGGAPVIVSVAGARPSEFLRLSRMAEDAGADGVELNLSCPHVRGHGIEIGGDPVLVRRIVGAVSGEVSIPVHVKLGLSDRMQDSASAAEVSGADAVVAINTIRAMVVDVFSRRAVLSNVQGGLSGPAIHPIAVRCVYDLGERLSIPVIGCGGVEDWRGALSMIMAGASAVQIGTAVAARGLEVFGEVTRGIEKYMRDNGFKKVEELIGIVRGGRK